MRARGPAVAALLLALVASCSSSGASSRHRVVYMLGGHAPAGAAITYSTPDNGTERQDYVSVPMTTKRAGAAGIALSVSSGASLYFSAQNHGDGQLTCTIREDGRTVASDTASGRFAIVTCTARA